MGLLEFWNSTLFELWHYGDCGDGDDDDKGGKDGSGPGQHCPLPLGRILHPTGNALIYVHVLFVVTCTTCTGMHNIKSPIYALIYVNCWDFQIITCNGDMCVLL